MRIKTCNESDSVNVELPVSALKDRILTTDLRAVAHFEKTWPGQPWGCDFELEVECKVDANGQQVSNQQSNSLPLRHTNLQRRPAVGAVNLSGLHMASQASGTSEKSVVVCESCNHDNDEGVEYCEKCGSVLELPFETV